MMLSPFGFSIPMVNTQTGTGGSGVQMAKNFDGFTGDDFLNPKTVLNTITDLGGGTTRRVNSSSRLPSGIPDIGKNPSALKITNTISDFATGITPVGPSGSFRSLPGFPFGHNPSALTILNNTNLYSQAFSPLFFDAVSNPFGTNVPRVTPLPALTVGGTVFPATTVPGTIPPVTLVNQTVNQTVNQNFLNFNLNMNLLNQGGYRGGMAYPGYPMQMMPPSYGQMPYGQSMGYPLQPMGMGRPPVIYSPTIVNLYQQNNLQATLMNANLYGMGAAPGMYPSSPMPMGYPGGGMVYHA